MSDFKFACPVCGQHITCDSASSGTQMDCPTCFRKLVVPQAPAPGASGFVLNAAEVQTRPIPLPGNGQAAASPVPASSKKLPLLVLVVVALVLAAGAGVFVFRGKLFPPAPPPTVAVTNAPAPATVELLLPPSTNWTLQVAEAQIPEAPASGIIKGRRFTLERAVIQEGRLDLRQGATWPPDVGVSIHLFAKRTRDLVGQTVVIEATRTNAPRVILRWKDEQGKALSKDFRKGYAARLEFGAVTNNRLEGKIFLATPDDLQSYAAGTFSAEIRKPAPPKK